ncbi:MULTISPECIES: alpha/beta hydrolase [unclassified Streptomyces]|uniref:alpha/beta hydrolase n=1 Tax=unclassified Streptomyces TaxID=2593676 RepID=UPI0038080850
MRARTVTATAAALTAVVLAGAACSPPVPPPGSRAAAHAPDRFAGQAIAWHACRTGPDDTEGEELDAAGARCGEVTVPLDHRHPEGATLDVAVSRLPATDPARRRGALFYNPGGPGVPARYLSLLLRRAEPEVAARYDLIGMDPRFVGRSAPLDCGWPTVSVGAAGPDRAGFEKNVRLARELASLCAGRRSVLPHASTRNTARDMDVVRSALGERRVSYLGSSYGTYLGEVYLQLFPGRVDRAVLDSPLDPDLFGPDLTRTAGPAVERALRRWAGWAARHDDRYHLGATGARVRETVGRLTAAVDRRPVRIGGHTVDSRVLPQLLWGVTAGDDAEAYGGFAADVGALVAAARGDDGVEVPSGLAATLEGLASADGDGTFSAQTAIQCADRAVSRDPETSYRDIEAHRADEPVFGPLTRTVTPCSFWPVAPAEPRTRVRNDVPVLLVGASGDPAAVRAGQLSAHRALTGSRLVTLPGAFRHTVYAGLFAARDACVERAVNTYLVDGVLPDRDVTCPRPAPAP